LYEISYFSIEYRIFHIFIVYKCSSPTDLYTNRGLLFVGFTLLSLLGTMSISIICIPDLSPEISVYTPFFSRLPDNGGLFLSERNKYRHYESMLSIPIKHITNERMLQPERSRDTFRFFREWKIFRVIAPNKSYRNMAYSIYILYKEETITPLYTKSDTFPF